MREGNNGGADVVGVVVVVVFQNTKHSKKRKGPELEKVTIFFALTLVPCTIGTRGREAEAVDEGERCKSRREREFSCTRSCALVVKTTTKT